MLFACTHPDTPISSQEKDIMRTYLKRALWGTLLAGGITLLGATAANAADTSGEDGLLSGCLLYTSDAADE